MSEGGLPPPLRVGEPKTTTPSELHVTHVDISVDRSTLDRVFVVYSREGEPITLRMSPVAIPVYLKALAAAILRSLH